MLGAIGETYIGERLFIVICKPGNKVFDLNDYLIYQDILYHGTDEEKSRNQFRMLDINNNGKVERTEYINFQMKFMSSMSTLFHFKMDLQESKLAAQKTWEYLVKDKDEKEFITQDDLYNIRINNPQLLQWLHKPEQFLR